LPTTEQTDYTIASVEKAVAVLLCFLDPPHAFGVSELSRRMNLNKNQTFRLLATLQQSGLLDRTAEAEYRLSWRMMELGQIAAGSIDLRRIAGPIAAQLAAATVETVILVTYDGVDASCVGVWESPQSVKVSAQAGERFPLHAGACPKAILAGLPEAQGRAGVDRHGFIRYTDRTVQNWETLLPELEQIRRQGYSLSGGDVNDDVEAVGVVIKDRTGRVVGAISAAGPAYRFVPRIAEIANLVRRAAGAISAELGAVAD
jgi:DNA-binding IclR family transcriptional regulator